MGPAGDKVRNGVITGRNDVQELGQTFEDAAVVRVGKSCSESRWQCPESILAPGAGTVELQEPRDLEVWDCRKGLEESTMLRGKSLEIRNNEFVCAQGRSKDPQATSSGGKLVSPTQVCSESGAGGKLGGSTPREFQTRVLAALRRQVGRESLGGQCNRCN